jgi:hypothetical protein
MPFHPFLHPLALSTLSSHSMHLCRFYAVSDGFWTVLSHDQCVFPACMRPALLAPSIRISILMIADHLNHFSNFYLIYSSFLTSAVVTMHDTHHTSCTTLSCLKRIPFDVQTEGRHWHRCSFVFVFHSIYPLLLHFSHLLLYPCHACITFFQIRHHHRIRLEKLLGTFMRPNR